MQIAKDTYGIHTLISAAKYLDRTYGYSLLTEEQLRDNPLHRAIGMLTDRVPDEVFRKYYDDREEYAKEATAPPRRFKITYYTGEMFTGYKVNIPNYDGGEVVEAKGM